MPDATAELIHASADIPLTRDAREILERATQIATTRGSLQVSPADILAATLQLPGTLAEREIEALGLDPKAIASEPGVDGAAASPTLRQLLVNANREAEVLGHYQVDSIHLLLAMLYTDTPSTAARLQKAGLTLYDLRRHLQTGSRAGVPSYRDTTRPDTSLRRKPWPSLRGVLGISPVFGGIVAATAASGAALWFAFLPAYVSLWTVLFVVGGWVLSLCIHEFAHAFVAYLGGDRSVVGAGYLSLNPLRYTNVTVSLILPIIFLLLGGVALPGGAVYINHAALRTRAWSSAVSIAGPLGTLLCGLAIAAVFAIATPQGWINGQTLNFFAALALLGFFMAFAVLLNFVPVPGLDGFGVLRPWLPYSIQYAAMRYSLLAIYAVFAVLWFVAPVRQAFSGAVYQLTIWGGIDQALIFFGQLNMRFI
ncbi:MAG TPA: Clp protease N-terminal domain-containing protein [Candidatus Dormibacteraeota bacterium]|nr:Clp protease N-terminal domain-containing protein [Candidatus Dormibacteraeota bacterium]